MGKKRKSEHEEEKIRSKIRRLEERLQKEKIKKKKHRIIYSSEDSEEDIVNRTAETNADSMVAALYAARKSTPVRNPSVADAPVPFEAVLFSPPRPMSPLPGTSQSALPAAATLEPDRSTAPAIQAIASEDQTDKDLDEDILIILGDAPKPETNFGNNIHKDIAARWQEILVKGLSKEVKDKLLKEYLIPANCEFLVPPTLNPEAKAALSEALVKRDNSLVWKQKQIGVALAALAQATDLIISKETCMQKILKPLSDASRLLCDSHNLETKTRRNFVISSINSSLKDTLIDTSRDKYLFGENVTEKLKAAKTIQRSGEVLKNQQKQQFNKNNFINNKNKNRLNSRALHPKTVSKPDAGQHRSAPRPTASRPPPRRSNRSPPPPPQRRSHHHSRR